MYDLLKVVVEYTGNATWYGLPTWICTIGKVLFTGIAFVRLYSLIFPKSSSETLEYTIVYDLTIC